MTKKVIEDWINSSLLEAEYKHIHGREIAPSKAEPLIRYGIDRQTMVAKGITTQQCDSIYRALYVYTVGFFETLKQNV